MRDDGGFEEGRQQLGRVMGRNIKVPSTAEWRIEHGDPRTIVARVAAQALDGDMQKDSAAVPFFAVTIAWWFERLEICGRGPVRLRLEIEGQVPDTAHARRNTFVIHELARLLPDRFVCVPPLAVSWPSSPLLNAEGQDRNEGAQPDGESEHAIEVALSRQDDLVEQFASIDALGPFRRQLPVGLFDGAKSRNTRWAPGSYVDLWAPSLDGRTIHVFELKRAGNCKVGILPEALWYARLLHRIRVRDFGGKEIAGGAEAMDTIRAAERISMWLLVQDAHPLVFHDGASPLAWLRDGLSREAMTFGILPYELEGGRIRLRPERRWT